MTRMRIYETVAHVVLDCGKYHREGMEIVQREMGMIYEDKVLERTTEIVDTAATEIDSGCNREDD